MSIEPRFIDRPAMIVVGMGTRFEPTCDPGRSDNPIPGLWHRFMQVEGTIRNRVKGPTYGVMERVPGDDAPCPPPPRELFYIACVPVSEVDPMYEAGGDAENPWLVRHVPAGRYASFTHKGKLDTLNVTLQAIYQVWLPANRSLLRPGPDIELYDHRFSLDSDESEFDTLLPVW